MDSYGKVTVIERDEPTDIWFRIDRGRQHVDLQSQYHSTTQPPYRRSHYVKENRALSQKHRSTTSDNVSYVRFTLGFSLDFRWFLVFKRFGALGAGDAKCRRRKESTRFPKNHRFLNCGNHTETAESFPNLGCPTGVAISKDRWTFRKS